jgi:hypothetical protein
MLLGRAAVFISAHHADRYETSMFTLAEVGQESNDPDTFICQVHTAPDHE